MKFNYVFFLAFLLIAGHISLQAQALRGKLIDNNNQNPVANAKITEIISGQTINSDATGYFEVNRSQISQQIKLEVMADQYKPFQIQIGVEDWGSEIQEFFLHPVLNAAEARLENLQSEENDEESTGDVYSLLSSSDHILLRVSGFEWSPFRFKLKGLSNAYDQLGFNGFLLNDLEYGRLPFHLFSGLTLVSRYSDDYIGYKDNAFDFGSAGIGQWITAHPAAYRKEFSVNVANTNRNYSHRLGVHYASGIKQKGISYVAGATRRWGQEAYVPGTFYDAWGAYVGLSKAFNTRNQLTAFFIYAPVIRGKSSPGVQEVFDLSGDPYYNSYWGYQNGEKRNSREVKTSSPALFLNYRLNISESLSFQAGIMGLASKRYDSQLDWHNAPDPRPDYYQKLPSSIEDSAVAMSVANLWKTDVHTRQIDWQNLYQANYNNFQTILGANGDPNQILNGKRAVYWLSKRFSNISEIEHFGNLNWTRKRHEFNLKYRFEISNLRQYLEVGDLLGADFVVDVEDFIDQVENQHPDILHSNKIVRENEKYGYDYEVNSKNISLMAGYLYYGKHIDVSFSAQVKNSDFQRTGFWENAIFSNSNGKSASISSTGLSAKLLLTWKMNGRNYVQLNSAYQQLPNRFDQIFVNPEWRADVLAIDDLTKVMSNEINYHYRSPNLKVQLGAYYVQLKDQIINKNFFLDEQLESAANPDLSDGSLINAFFTGYHQNHLGIEGSAELKLTAGVKIIAAGALGDHYISSRPTLHLFDKFSQATTSHLIYIKNYKVHGSAEKAASLGIFCDLPKSGFVVLTANYLSDQYLELNPLRRIPQAVDEIDRNSQQFAEILAQEKFPSVFYLNLFAFKPFKLFKKNFTASMSVQNILNSQDYRSGGFEQFRFDYDTKNPKTFPSKYYYFQGINYYISLTWRI
ncbi:MAG: hypothetical protein IPM92_05575 [Saprospiraceae bacterium]|nr:hypothetical protein [Saprospiraceae bacterium]